MKSQVDPHFLFNSLNSLSALIRTDPKRAEQFVEELSRVYRYLLRGREHDLSSLEDELEFIRSYEHLLKTRFGKGFVLKIAVDEHLLGRRLPAQALQLLVENTVKHNVISEAQPLTVTIRTVGNDRLEVHNNLQRRNSRMHSNKVGLVNITERFRLLGAPPVQVEETAADFRVILPLLGE
ncbi:MAG: histidine kinase [Flavobacteriales bacterium]|nr:MAG: histidine kinase [Flavobacteriales bacterium]